MLDPLLRLIALPLLGGIACALTPDRTGKIRAWLAIFVCASMLPWSLAAHTAGPISTVSGLFRIDALSGFILLATVVFSLLIAIYSLGYMVNQSGQRLYYFSLLWSLAFACGVLLAADMLVFATFWGLLAVTLYLMIGISGSKASEAAKKTLMMVGGTDALLVLGAAILWIKHGTTLMAAEPLTLSAAEDYLAFFCFVAAAFAKAAIMPLHSWLPDSAQQAHAPVTAFLPASLDKLLGIYLLVRIVTDWFVVPYWINNLLMLIGAVTIVGSVLMALVQHDLKRLLGIQGVSQAGYMVLAIGTGSPLGIAAGLFHMLNHATYKSCLFLCAGIIERKTGTVDLDRLGGLATRLPAVFVASLIAALAISGVPPLSGFASKWMIYQAVIESGQSSGTFWWSIWLTAAILGTALTLACFVKVLHSVFLCKPSPQVRQQEIHRAEYSLVIPILLLAAVCVLFGVAGQATAIQFLVAPAVDQPIELSGTWLPGRTTLLFGIAFLLGWLVYAVALRGGQLRRTKTFIGGELLAEARIPGVPVGPDRHVEVTGVDFYETVERLPLLNALLRMAKAKAFDLYDLIGRFTASLAELLRAAHAGLLPVYLGWCLLGLLGILYLMMERNP